MLTDARHHELAQELRRALGITSEEAEERVQRALDSGPEAFAVLLAEVRARTPSADPTSFLAAPREERPARRKSTDRPPGPPSPPPAPPGNKVA